MKRIRVGSNFVFRRTLRGNVGAELEPAYTLISDKIGGVNEYK